MKDDKLKVLTGKLRESQVAKEFLSAQNLNLLFAIKSLTNSEPTFWSLQHFAFQSSTSEFSANRLNDFTILQLEKKFTGKLLNLILTEDFEYGTVSKSELLIKEQLESNSAATKLWLNNIYLKQFKSPAILVGILRIISRFPQKTFEPVGQTIAIASLSHKNEEVAETAIRIFENWGGATSLEILQNIEIKSQWIENYRNAVIKDIEAELCLSS
jgi:hypothetical protein